MRNLMLAALGVAALGLAAPAVAQSDSDPAKASDQAKANAIDVKGEKKDDNDEMGKADRVICRKIQTIGSRLNTQRVCATAAQWSAMKQEGREGLDRIQTQRYNGNGG